MLIHRLLFLLVKQLQSSPVRQRSSLSGIERELDRVLVVIAVTLEGSARRLVTVRSALQVTNNLEETVELRLEPPPFSHHQAKVLRVPPCTTYPIPMSHLTAQASLDYLIGLTMHIACKRLTRFFILDFCTSDG